MNVKEWFGRHPSLEMCKKEKKLLLVEILDGIADPPPIECFLISSMQFTKELLYSEDNDLP